MTLLPRILFAITFFALYFGGMVYLRRRLVRDAGARPRLERWTQIAVPVIALLMLATMLGSRGSAWSKPAVLAATLWLALVLNMLVIMVPLDVLRALITRRRKSREPVSPERRQFLSRALAATTVSAGAGLTAFGVYRAYEPPRITEVSIKIANWPKALDGFTITQLTDIHIGSVLREKFLDDLVERANAVNGDMTIITGDIVDGNTMRLGKIVARTQRLQAKYGRFFVTGNHDFYSGADAWCEVMSGLGFDVLRNRSVRVGQGKDAFRLIGVDDWGHRRGGNAFGRDGESGGYDLDAAMAGVHPDEPTVLLSHQPQNVEEVARRGIGLMISGHTHGGQLFPSTLVADLIYGKRVAGLSREGNSQFFVSRGCGFVGPPERDGAPSEICKLVITS